MWTYVIIEPVLISLSQVQLTQELALNPCKSVSRLSQTKPMYEMKLLQNTLTKIARLLQIGYGSAGAAIISKNMSGDAFNPIMPGRKVHAVFGFCDIRRFTDITECLQEHVMMFTNTIGHIVHHAAYSFHGHANKNIGDAFLLVWNIPDDSAEVTRIKQARPPAHLAPTIINDDNDDDDDNHAFLFFDEEGSKTIKQLKMMAQHSLYVHPDPRDHPQHHHHQPPPPPQLQDVATVADNALMAFLKTMVDIDNSSKLIEYETHPALRERFPELPCFHVKMGYGLHAGWAIDGAIGSRYKIDASYLSSDVNLTSALESTSKIYRVPLIMSHTFYHLLSPYVQRFCRCIDCVLLDTCSTPIALYTCDYVNTDMRQFQGMTDLPTLQLGLVHGFISTFDKGLQAYFTGSCGWTFVR
jgi:class 3 adenylate cyclase